MAKHQRQFTRRRYEPLYKRLAIELTNRIISRQLPPGERLPEERLLCEQMGASRGTVRSALKQLEQQGLVRRVRGQGTFVANDEAGRGTPFGLADTILWLHLDSSPGAAPPRVGTFYGEMRNGVHQAAYEMGLNVKDQRIVSPVKAPLAEYVPPKAKDVRGVVLCGTFDDQYIGMFRSERVPTVVVDYWTSDRQIDCVTVDVQGEALMAVEHLAGLGHRTLGFLAVGRIDGRTGLRSFDPDVWHLLNHLRGAAGDYGIHIRDEWVVATVCERDQRGAVEGFLNLKSRPTAVLCFDQQTADPLHQAIARRRIRCPQDLSIVTRGPDGLRGSVIEAPPTMLASHPEVIGQWAVKLLADRVRGRRHTVRLAVASDLRLGQTTGPAPRG